ncbi:long-chain-fatty-acid--CoA ligase [Tomitella gaofuii]|uniref:long-chain-fatty-acid--CoA ligase n=1 Tax=Tomitella gaofuii TaxID=2760083 RepID=UPI0015FA8C86|nr:long-chain fatty acid--CoA ligase [Tomitella gaofuii]
MSTLSLAAVLAEPARRLPGKTAVIEGDRRVTYADLWLQARRYARYLADQGVAPGDHVAIMCPNTIEFVRAYYGALAAGAVVVPVPTMLRPEEVEYMLADSGAGHLIVPDGPDETARTAAACTGATVLPAHCPPDTPAVSTYATRSPEDVAVLFYTSGTTGKPKGALLTHLNLVMCATANAIDANPFERDDIVLGCLPLFHTFGQTVSMNSTFRIGATLVLQPRFDAAEAVELMRSESVTAFFGVPTMFIRLTEAARHAEAVTSLRMCISGGASLPVAALSAFEEAFHTTIYEGYGLSETSPTASVNQPDFGVRPGSIGHSIWGVDVEIADPDVEGRIALLDTGRRGEIVVRGHNVFSGYHGRPEATAEVLVDGWFRTGDIGVKDDDGFLFVVDRKKDLIIRGGYNVYPRELEEVLMRHPAVSQAAVIGVPDADVGEEVCAIVVPRPGGSVDADALYAWAREHLGKQKYPRRIEVVDALPLGPSHKVLKRELRKQFDRSDPAASGTAPAGTPA